MVIILMDFQDSRGMMIRLWCLLSCWTHNHTAWCKIIPACLNFPPSSYPPTEGSLYTATALTEHASLNLAGSFLLDPVYLSSPSSYLDGNCRFGVIAQCGFVISTAASLERRAEVFARAPICPLRAFTPDSNGSQRVKTTLLKGGREMSQKVRQQLHFH